MHEIPYFNRDKNITGVECEFVVLRFYTNFERIVLNFNKLIKQIGLMDLRHGLTLTIPIF